MLSNVCLLIKSFTCSPICYPFLASDVQQFTQYLSFSSFCLFRVRQVAETEGASLAASHGIGFCEVSVAENTPNLYKAIERLLTDARGRPVKQRKFSVCKMLGELKRLNRQNQSNRKPIGNLVFRENRKKKSLEHNNNNNSKIRANIRANG